MHASSILLSFSSTQQPSCTQAVLQIQGHMYLLGMRVQHVSRIQECRVDSEHAKQHSTSCCPERSTKDNEKALQAVVLVVFLDFENVIHVCGLEYLFQNQELPTPHRSRRQMENNGQETSEAMKVNV